MSNMKAITVALTLAVAILACRTADAQDDGAWIVPSHAQRSLDNMHVYENGRSYTVPNPPGTGTAYVFPRQPDPSELRRLNEQIERDRQLHECCQ